MTYIEFFDKTASENVCACLTHIPDRVIYLGNNAKLMQKHIANYERVFFARGFEIEFQYKSVSYSKIENILNVLTEIVETYDDCVFDVTGGDEMLVMALGMVYARYPDKNIQIHKFNLRSNVVYDCDLDGNTVYHETPTLSVNENIRIYGGEVVYGDIQEEKTYLWELTPEFREDLDRMWEICSYNDECRKWNTQISVWDAAAAVAVPGPYPCSMTARISDIETKAGKKRTSYKKITGIINALKKAGLVTYFNDSDGATMTVAFKNEQVRRCLTKAGQALEMMIFKAMKDSKESDGTPVYDDVLNGVVIDWDGDFHEEELAENDETKNEMDILAMHDTVPVFISCKNGVVTSSELYKLYTVAQRFGGPYSRMVLVTTALSDMNNPEHIRQRASDMNIRILEDVQKMTPEALAKRIRTLWCS